MLKKLFIVWGLFSSTFVLGYNPAVLMEVDIKKNETSFVGLGYDAIESFTNLYNVKIPIFSAQGNKYNKENIIEEAIKKGHNPIIALGFLYSKPIQKMAKKFPNKTFIIIAGNAGDGKNTLNINFKDEEGSFLVGAIAAMKSKSNKIGFIGGMDIPAIRRFTCGYIQGIHYINPKAKVFVKMAGNDYLAFNNPKKGEKIAIEMIKDGVDVIFHASDRTGKGVIKAAKENKIYAIGVDSNQNGEAPGYVLTSMIKRIDIALYKILIDSMNNQLNTKDKRLGLKEEGIGWVLDKYNINLINSQMQEEIDTLEFNIIHGIIKVEDYIKENKCTQYNFKKE